MHCITPGTPRAITHASSRKRQQLPMPRGMPKPEQPSNPSLTPRAPRRSHALSQPTTPSHRDSRRPSMSYRSPFRNFRHPGHRWPFLLLPFLLVMLSSCAGTPPAAIQVPVFPRAKPMEAMQPCAQFLSQLPPNLGQLPREQQIKLLALAHVQDAAKYFPCSHDQAAEAQWINGGGS